MKTTTREAVIEIMNQADIDSDLSTLDPSKNLDEQGVDSLDMINALLAIQENFGIEINDEEIASGIWSSVDGIVENLNKRSES